MLRQNSGLGGLWKENGKNKTIAWLQSNLAKLSTASKGGVGGEQCFANTSFSGSEELLTLILVIFIMWKENFNDLRHPGMTSMGEAETEQSEPNMFVDKAEVNEVLKKVARLRGHG